MSYWAVEPRAGEDGLPDIKFSVLKPGAPQEQILLKNSIEQTLRLIKLIYSKPTDEPKLKESVSKLLALSQAGLVGKSAAPLIAKSALQALEAEIVEQNAGRIKNDYMAKLGMQSLIFGLPALISYTLYEYIPTFPLEQIHTYRNFFIVWTGSMVGAWASFSSRKVVLELKDLTTLEEDRIQPQLRLLFTGVLTIILALIFTTGVADIHIGDFKTSNILTSGSDAFLLGVFAGLAEKTLPSAILARANTVVMSITH